jgi:phospholipase/carboxylesterase
MNRLTTLAPRPAVPARKGARPAAESVLRSLSPAGIQTFAPLHYEPNYSYPLLVWIHDDGGNASDLQRVMPLVSVRNYVGAAITGEAVQGRRGCVWRSNATATLAAENQLADAIELATRRFRIHADRIFLAGSGTGGTLAMRLALRNPRKYAGAATIGGSFPEGQAPLAALEHARDLPLFIAHGRDSLRYPIERLCDELHLFHTASLGVNIRQYPCEDEVTTQMLHDLDVWLMERVTGMPAEAAQTPVAEGWN